MGRESKTQSILSVLAELSSRRLTGTLSFETVPNSEEGIQFLFHKGRLLYATSNIPGERLGEFLVRRGLLTAEQASAALWDSRQQGRLFQAHLVREGLIGAEELPQLLYERTEELLDLILHFQDGRIIFHPELPGELQEMVLGVDQEMFGRLIQHRDVWPKIYEKLGDPSLRLRCHPGIRGSAAFTALSPQEQKLLEVLDGSVSISRLLGRRKDRVELMIVLGRFLESGLVEALDREPGSAEAALEKGASAEPSRVSGSSLLEDFLEDVPSEPPPAVAAFADPDTGAPLEDQSFDETLNLLEKLEDSLLDKAPELLTRSGQAELKPFVPTPIRKARFGASSEEMQAPDLETVALTPTPPPDTFPEPTALELSIVPCLQPGVRLAEMSTTGLMMGDFFLLSQIDGKRNLRELAQAAQMSEKHVNGTVFRLLRKGYLTVRRPASEPVLEPPVAVAAAWGAAEPEESEKTQAMPAAAFSDSQQAHASYEVGVAALGAGAFGEAAEQFKVALTLLPGVPLYMARLAVALLETESELDEARNLAEAAVLEAPRSGVCQEALGLVRLRLGNISDARELLSKAQSLDRKSVPSCGAILALLRSYVPPRGGGSPDHLWRLILPKLKFDP